MSRYADAFDKLHLQEKNNVYVKILDLIGKRKRVIDFGCSAGYLGEVLKKDYNCQVWGVEINKEDAKKAKDSYEKVIISDIEDYSFWKKEIGKEKFDVAIFADVLEHLKDPVRALKETKKILKTKNGFVVASIPNVAHLSLRVELLLGRWRYESQGLLDKTHLRFFTLPEVIKLFGKAGLYITKIDYTIKDVPKKTVGEYLTREGLTLSSQLEQVLYAPDSLAYQYVVKATATKPKSYKEPAVKVLPKLIQRERKVEKIKYLASKVLRVKELLK